VNFVNHQHDGCLFEVGVASDFDTKLRERDVGELEVGEYSVGWLGQEIIDDAHIQANIGYRSFSGQEIGIDLVGAEVKYDLGELI